jgi:hypothetical protein
MLRSLTRGLYSIRINRSLASICWPGATKISAIFPSHQPFEKNFVLAEGGFCLPLGAQHAIEEFVFAFDWACHARLRPRRP